MKALIALLFIVMFVPASQAPFELPEGPQVGSQITWTQNYVDNADVHWHDSSWTMIICYLYPFTDDIATRYGGMWRWVETHEEGISYTITFNRYINWSSSNYTPIQFNMTSLKVSWSTNSLTSYDVEEGFNGSIISNASISEDGREKGVTVSFELTSSLDLVWSSCELLTYINFSIAFVTTWEYWEWICGSVVSSDTESLEIMLAAFIIIGTIFSALKINEYDQRKEKIRRNENERNSTQFFRRKEI